MTKPAFSSDRNQSDQSQMSIESELATAALDTLHGAGWGAPQWPSIFMRVVSPAFSLSMLARM